MITFPNCKINLGLHVTGKRPDGYHSIESILYPAGLCDVLEIVPAQASSLSLSGTPIPGHPEDNLVMKALKLMENFAGKVQCHIYLHKAIPAGSGLGGGSSDGAFALKMLNLIFKAGLSEEELRKTASLVGSDCPFFIANRPVYAFGKGDCFEDIHLDLSGYCLALVIPDIQVSTAEAYSGVHPSPGSFNLKELPALPVNEWKNVLVNDFEKTVFEKHPAIAEIRSKLYRLGALYSAMSGSGSAVFGIFERPIDLNRNFDDCKVWIKQERNSP
ncbi:MAG: 4-(cytidine 5'-diphospho)-2-C-methyl-D-erythritol kinase [Bacteroidales bacterium]|nr:4-(cytidine 5'-diphospho)-2-C-methyl-D-erythritol kinase [Bacteroidales bacterium]